MPDRYLTSPQLAHAFQVSTETIARWRKDGCPFFVTNYGKYLDTYSARYRYDAAKLPPWLEKQTKKWKFKLDD